MTVYYSDIDSLVETLKTVIKRHKDGTVRVVDSEAVIDGLTITELQERNLVDYSEGICAINWSGGDSLLGPLNVEIRFHENVIRNKFWFNKSGGYYSRLSDLSNELNQIECRLTDEVETDREDTESLGLPRPYFAEINSGSLSTDIRDGLADREFKYETSGHYSNFD